jgi:IS5 family transposase
MLQYVRRNLKQIRDLLQTARDKRKKVLRPLWGELHVAEEIFRQQWEMYKKKTRRIANRNVSLHKPYVWPIRTRKQAQDTEFGAKGALVHMDAFLFLDHFKHAPFNEAELAVHHVTAYQERFRELPRYLVGDHKYGTQKNQERVIERSRQKWLFQQTLNNKIANSLDMALTY